MTQAELRQQAHAALDAMLDATAFGEGGEAAVARWCRGLVQLFRAVAHGAKLRQYGKVVLAVQMLDGRPDPNKGIEAGFVATVK